MKLERLHTSRQFIDLQKITSDTSQLNRIYKYNDFLKQPVTKEMFVNTYKAPEPVKFGDTLPAEMWEEAEKKVIFKGWKSKGNNVLEHDKYILIYEKGYDMFKLLNRRSDKWAEIRTLHDLAEATNGELEIQNVKL
jgi:hypothetical protein